VYKEGLLWECIWEIVVDRDEEEIVRGWSIMLVRICMRRTWRRSPLSVLS
jgi:hypothetical protein